MAATKCFACDRVVGNPVIVTCIDDQTVEVGACCFRKTKRAGTGGYQPPKGGPRLFTIEAKQKLIAMRDKYLIW